MNFWLIIAVSAIIMLFFGVQSEKKSLEIDGLLTSLQPFKFLFRLYSKFRKLAFLNLDWVAFLKKVNPR